MKRYRAGFRVVFPPSAGETGQVVGTRPAAVAGLFYPADADELAAEWDCGSVAFTYNDPVIFAEYAIDVAEACHERGIRTVAVSAGYIQPEPRRDLFAVMDAANIDLKGFTEDFYHRLSGAHLKDVLDTLVYLRTQTDVWFELTTLLIPGHNDSDAELRRMFAWVARELGPDVPTTSPPSTPITGCARSPPPRCPP